MKKVLLPRGTYYIGDPCCIFNKSWGRILEETNCFKDKSVELFGKPCFVSSVKSGADGIYTDNLGVRYSADSGFIGVMPIDFIFIDNKVSGADIESSNNMHIITFNRDFECYESDGAIHIKDNISIDTTKTHNTPTLKQRMYFLVMYNLSPMQQGIQAGHSSLEYVERFGQTKEYRDFIKNDKTWIVLSGGTSNDMLEYYSLLNSEIGVNVVSFQEPDLNMSTSAICFLADERVWDRENYPDVERWCSHRGYFKHESHNFCSVTPTDEGVSLWTEFIGGEKNVKLREFLKTKKLA